MKQVLMFGWEYPPEISGGLGIATHEILAALTRKKIAVDFVLPTFKKSKSKTDWKIISASDVRVKTGEVIEEEFWEKITFIEVGTRLMPYLTFDDYRELKEHRTTGIIKKVKILKESFQFEGGYGKNLMEEVTRMALVGTELASSKEYDVIHAHDWMTFPAALATGAKAKKPVILHVHSTEFERSFPNLGQEIYDLEKNSLQKANHIITVSQLTKNILVEHYDIASEQITVAHNSYSNSFNTSVKKKTSKKITVTFLGRLARQKAPSLFIDVAKSLSDRNSNYQFIMAGEGYLMDELKSKVQQLNLTNRFSFPGFLSTSRVKNLFSKSDIFLLPASAEPFGMVALEAAASGVPVFLSNQTGAKEALPSVISFECWETYKMANAIDEMVNHPTELKAYAKTIQKEAKKTSWDRSAEKILEVYNCL